MCLSFSHFLSSFNLAVAHPTSCSTPLCKLAVLRLYHAEQSQIHASGLEVSIPYPAVPSSSSVYWESVKICGYMNDGQAEKEQVMGSKEAM